MRYTKQDLEYIRECYERHIPNKDIALHLNRSEAAISQVASAFHLSKTRWNPIKDKILKENYKKIPTPVLAKQLGCTIWQLYNRAATLDLNKHHN